MKIVETKIIINCLHEKQKHEEGVIGQKDYKKLKDYHCLIILFETINPQVDTIIQLKLEYSAIGFIINNKETSKPYFEFNINNRLSPYDLKNITFTVNFNNNYTNEDIVLIKNAVFDGVGTFEEDKIKVIRNV